MFSNSRGHRMMVDTFPTSLFSELEPNMVLTIETKKNYTWKTSEWSKCSETCGNSGYQIRKIACVYREDNATYEVDADFCEKDFLEKPETKRRCSLGECPTWKVTDWNSCESAKCVGHHEGNFYYATFWFVVLLKLWFSFAEKGGSLSNIKKHHLRKIQMQ